MLCVRDLKGGKASAAATTPTLTPTVRATTVIAMQCLQHYHRAKEVFYVCNKRRMVLTTRDPADRPR